MKRAAILFLLAFSCAHAAPKPRPDLNTELLAMADADQRILKQEFKEPQNQALRDEFHAQNRAQVTRLREIIREVGGWPGKSITSEKGSAAAWTIFQHADPEVLHEFVPMMERAAKEGELSFALVATTIDRDRIHEGKRQIYGTQFDTRADKCEPMPLDDPEHIDDRRREAGLGPLKEYADQLCALFKGNKK
jgi:hypothetical protein